MIVDEWRRTAMAVAMVVVDDSLPPLESTGVAGLPSVGKRGCRRCFMKKGEYPVDLQLMANSSA